jgi:flagellar export protein FliJ
VKTPFDSATRALQREIDDMRTSIGDATRTLGQIEEKSEELRAAVRREAEVAAEDWRVPSHHYQAHARTQRQMLAGIQHTAEQRLDSLRDQAIESYGSLSALEGAADRFRDEFNRAIASAEQAAVDDFAGALFARRLRSTRKPSGRTGYGG